MKYKESFFNVEVMRERNRTLVYNSYSQAVSWFDDVTYSSFKNKTAIESDALLKDIIRLGFCVPSDEDEVQKFVNERKQAYLNHTHLEYVIAPTLKCNMQCIYCFENASKKAFLLVKTM